MPGPKKQDDSDDIVDFPTGRPVTRQGLRAPAANAIRREHADRTMGPAPEKEFRKGGAIKKGKFGKASKRK